MYNALKLEVICINKTTNKQYLNFWQYLFYYQSLHKWAQKYPTNRPYSQRAADIHARLLSVIIDVKTCTKMLVRQNVHKMTVHVFWHLRTMQIYNFCLIGGVHSFCACFENQAFHFSRMSRFLLFYSQKNTKALTFWNVMNFRVFLVKLQLHAWTPKMADVCPERCGKGLYNDSSFKKILLQK